MADLPHPGPIVTPTFITSMSRFTYAWELGQFRGTSTPAARTWVTNLIAYIPFVLPFPYPVKRVFWHNGSTITSTNVDMGIYSGSGVQLISTGSTAMAGASALQYANADILLSPGTYYFAWTCSGTTNRAFTAPAAAVDGRMAGLLQQVAAIPLPATMTGATWAQAFGAPLCGITRTSSGF